MNDECYFEGGPWDGTVKVLIDTPPVYVVMKSVDMAPVAYYAYGNPNEYFIEPPKTETLEYFREMAPHRQGCVTYFFTREAQARAYREDYYDPDDVPTGMLESCQPPLTIRASTPL